MAEQIAAYAQKIIGPLVVAAIITLFGIGVGTWRTADNNSRDIRLLEKWQEKTESNRYKKSDGVLERITRETADTLHIDKIKSLENENIRIWTAIRNHISLPEHKGADYRLTPLEEHAKDRRIHNGN